MTVAADQMKQYEGQKVTAVILPEEGTEGEPQTLEGKAEVANESGLILKAKGKSGLQLFSLERVESLEFAAEEPKKVTVKTVKVIGYGKVRQHLADRHGYTVTDLEDFSEEEALHTHNNLDHQAESVAHVHGDKKAAKEEEAE